MVNSFAEFAKMPEALLETQDILQTLLDVVELNKQANSTIKFDIKTNLDLSNTLDVAHDNQQIRQVLTNLIKNAMEAMDGDNYLLKTIHIIIIKDNDQLVVGVADNGLGLPENTDFEQLIEPYVTHKVKGTGLGLAIVKKIIEDHHGDLMFNPDLDSIKAMNIDYSTLIAFSLPMDGA